MLAYGIPSCGRCTPPRNKAGLDNLTWFSVKFYKTGVLFQVSKSSRTTAKSGTRGDGRKGQKKDGKMKERGGTMEINKDWKTGRSKGTRERSRKKTIEGGGDMGRSEDKEGLEEMQRKQKGGTCSPQGWCF